MGISPPVSIIEGKVDGKVSEYIFPLPLLLPSWLVERVFFWVCI